ncbi:MAG: hypothetical protein K2G63_01715 [Oscillospiraceae bacterium]|nr:hypothetical protein [Oscillospiraceae bacterium]
MKKLKRMMSGFLGAMMMVSMCSVNISSASAASYYAYSIGVNHGTTNAGLEGNFTQNVAYANTCYGMISGVASYYNNMPTQSYMKGNNPLGERKIASRVVFLNGHASSSRMYFNHNNNGGEYDTGVYYGYDTATCPGLLSTDMSTNDLISFVGCSTAAGTTNLASRAVSRGATTAVGFTESIHSRFINGPDWCRKYNDALVNGYTVANAITYATSCYPNSDLGKYVKVYGSSTNTIASNGSVNSISDDDEKVYVENVNIPIENVYSTKNIIDAELTSDFDVVIEELKAIDKSFDIDDYSIDINMFSEEDSTGMIIFTYRIGDLIDTNYALVASVSNGTITSISRNFEEKPIVDEEKLIEKVSSHSYSSNERRKAMNSLNINQNDIVSESESYNYDYRTNNLTFVKTIDYVERNAEEVVIANAFTTELN